MPGQVEKPPRLPPRWFIRMVWKLHRGIYRVTRGSLGLWRPKPNGWGTSRLTTTGRRTGQPRSVIIGYFTDGPNVVTMAMNGWGEAEPAWWLNLQANPDATVVTSDGQVHVRARAAHGEEHDRLWAQWREPNEKLDGFAARRPGQTAVVVLEPVADTRSASSSASDDERSRKASICCCSSAIFCSAVRDRVGAGDEAARRLLLVGDGQQRLGELGRVAALLAVLPSQNSRWAALRSA